MTPATDQYIWPIPSPADTARALDGISGDIARGLPPKIEDALIFLAAVRAADADPDPDRPIPFTLTAKAHAELDQDAAGSAPHCGCGYDDYSACAGSGWACLRCGGAYFGTPPGDGLCPACRAADGEP